MLTKEHIKNVCKIGQGRDCCRYLSCSVKGFECEKLGALKDVIDNRAKFMSAQSDNCEGVSKYDD